jgi:hypothetical protein
MTTKLLSIDTNAKTVKGQKYGYLTGILYMSPSDLSGVNLCPMAKTAGCEDPCLNMAGRGVFSNVQNARLKKANWFNTDKQSFMIQLVKDIESLNKKALKLGLTPLVRLNGTSDIRYESIKFDYEFVHGKVRSVTIFELFPEIQFYDYTKISNRKDIPANYDLTFSYSGLPNFQSHVNKAIKSGLRIAVVFRDKNKLPVKFLGLPVVNGDNSDIRHVDPKKSVVALYAKGKARNDKSGFVVDTYPSFTFKLID